MAGSGQGCLGLAGRSLGGRTRRRPEARHLHRNRQRSGDLVAEQRIRRPRLRRGARRVGRRPRHYAGNTRRHGHEASAFAAPQRCRAPSRLTRPANRDQGHGGHGRCHRSLGARVDCHRDRLGPQCGWAGGFLRRRPARRRQPARGPQRSALPSSTDRGRTGKNRTERASRSCAEAEPRGRGQFSGGRRGRRLAVGNSRSTAPPSAHRG